MNETPKYRFWFRQDRHFPIWIYLPWNNLGCFGIKLGWGMMGFAYLDIHDGGYIYCRIGSRRYNSHIAKPWKWSVRR